MELGFLCGPHFSIHFTAANKFCHSNRSDDQLGHIWLGTKWLIPMTIWPKRVTTWFS
jgi:hypothetical protein